MKKLLLSGLGAVALTFSMNAMAANFVEGKDYTVVANPGKRLRQQDNTKSVNFSGMAVVTAITLSRICKLG